MFITNKHNVNEQPGEEASMSARLRDLIPVTETLSILSGYFYFNGIPPLMEPIAANEGLKLRILVGLDVDRKGYELAHAGDGETAQERFLNSLRNVARSKLFDQETCARYMETFLKMMGEGRLAIKKTPEPNHAKLYLFEMNEKVKVIEPIRWITGSSNLTFPGLNSQNEFNVELSNFGGEEAKAYFEDLWEEAEEITGFVGMAEEIRKALREEGVHAEVTPYEAYALVLKNYLEHRALVDETPKIDRAFSIPSDPITGEAKYSPFAYQKDAVNQALSILQEYNGVIIADVVGLGKSVIGSVLGCVMEARRGIVVAPPGLVGSEMEKTGWCGYLDDFKMYGWRAMSRGKMDEIEQYVRDHPDIDVVLVDEAHYFRNEGSIDYDYLWRICRGKKVVLMTATPFSNRPNDMFALLKLFTVPRRSELVPDGDLQARFDEYQSRYTDCDYVLKNIGQITSDESGNLEKYVRNRLEKMEFPGADAEPLDVEAAKKFARENLEWIAKNIRAILEPVMIRRNRIDLKCDPDYSAEVGENLPTVHPPVEQFYELDPEQSAFYDQVITNYFGPKGDFKGAIYRPGLYVNITDGDPEEHETLKTQQENMYKFIRRLLVHRFESSFGAFAMTIDNLIYNHELVLKLAIKPTGNPGDGHRGVIILDRRMMEKFCDESMEDDTFETMLADYEDAVSVEAENKQIYRVAEDFTEEGYEKFIEDVESDIALFKAIKKRVIELDLVANDPKAKQLVEKIRAVLEGTAGLEVRKGEPKRKVLVFSEFADTVEHVAKYLEKAFPGHVCVVRSRSAEMERRIRRNFDGTIPQGKMEDEFDVMIATDKMSEGVNLNRAGLVINYDIPWNPTRVIQRLGRINRIGVKVFNDLYLYNYFPTDQGADLYNIRTIARNKVLMIHKTIGEDARIFDEDESLEAAGLFKRFEANPEDSETVTFLTECKIKWEEICQTHPEVVERIRHLPDRVKTVTTGTRAGTHLFTRKGLTLFAAFMDKDGNAPAYRMMNEALPEIECPFEQPRLEKFSEGFWDRYKKLTGEIQVSDHEEGNKSLANKTLPILMEAIANNVQREFAKKLRFDLLYRRTLPDHLLREIIRWRRQGLQTLEDNLCVLQESLGDRLAVAVPKQDDDGVIVTIDHTVEKPKAKGDKNEAESVEAE
ncbi:MAG: hypothetical protein IJR99_01725 [Kiritimatiellae bacterium]|nr:hypothetical protein [Kiritimatiellia bacterium]